MNSGNYLDFFKCGFKLAKLPASAEHRDEFESYKMPVNFKEKAAYYAGKTARILTAIPGTLGHIIADLAIGIFFTIHTVFEKINKCLGSISMIIKVFKELTKEEPTILAGTLGLQKQYNKMPNLLEMYAKLLGAR